MDELEESLRKCNVFDGTTNFNGLIINYKNNCELFYKYLLSDTINYSDITHQCVLNTNRYSEYYLYYNNIKNEVEDDGKNMIEHFINLLEIFWDSSGYNSIEMSIKIDEFIFENFLNTSEYKEYVRDVKLQLAFEHDLNISA